MAGARWVGVGAQVAEVLRGAYTAAIGRGSPAGTFDVLAHAARQPQLPLRLSAETGDTLRHAAFGLGHARPRYGAGEVDVVAPPDSDVDAVLRELEWRVRRHAGRMSSVRVDQV